MSERAIQNHVTATIAILMILTGCAAPRDPLVDVRSRMAAANANEGIRTHAAGSLAEARRTLALAADADEEDREHLIYLTQRNLDIADAVLERQKAEQELEALRRQKTAAREVPSAHTATRGAVETRPIDRPEPQQHQTAVPEPKPAEVPRSSSREPNPAATSRSEELVGSTVMTIPDVSFDSGTAALTPGAMRRLDGLISSLQQDPSLRAMIEGHTDNVGQHAANLEMSLSRAKAVKDYLTEQGVAADRIQTLGQGAKYPIASNETQEGRWRNRRVEIALYRTTPAPDQNARLPKIRQDRRAPESVRP